MTCTAEANEALGRAIAERAFLFSGGVIQDWILEETDRNIDRHLAIMADRLGWSDAERKRVRDEIAGAFIEHLRRLVLTTSSPERKQ